MFLFSFIIVVRVKYDFIPYRLQYLRINVIKSKFAHYTTCRETRDNAVTIWNRCPVWEIQFTGIIIFRQIQLTVKEKVLLLGIFFRIFFGNIFLRRHVELHEFRLSIFLRRKPLWFCFPPPSQNLVFLSGNVVLRSFARKTNDVFGRARVKETRACFTGETEIGPEDQRKDVEKSNYGGRRGIGPRRVCEYQDRGRPGRRKGIRRQKRNDVKACACREWPSSLVYKNACESKQQCSRVSKCSWL